MQKDKNEDEIIPLNKIELPIDPTPAIVKLVLDEVSLFIKSYPELARLRKQEIFEFLNKPQIVKNQQEAFDVRGLFYDVKDDAKSRREMNELSRLRKVPKEETSDHVAVTEHPIFNIPDTALALTKGSKLGGESLLLSAMKHNAVPIKEVIAIGRFDFHYAILKW